MRYNKANLAEKDVIFFSSNIEPSEKKNLDLNLKRQDLNDLIVQGGGMSGMWKRFLKLQSPKPRSYNNAGFTGMRG